MERQLELMKMLEQRRLLDEKIERMKKAATTIIEKKSDDVSGRFLICSTILCVFLVKL